MFCRKCKHTADGLGSAHEPTQRYRPGRFGSEIQLTKTKVLERSERMTPSKISTNRFSSEAGYHITVQIPQYHAQDLIKAVLKKTPLKYGDYDQVTFMRASGCQQFRSLGTGYNRATNHTVEVTCVEICFFLEQSDTMLKEVVTAIYQAHPYEEPVIFIQNCLRTLHIRGADIDNPNRFWNRQDVDWVPKAVNQKHEQVSGALRFTQTG